MKAWVRRSLEVLNLDPQKDAVHFDPEKLNGKALDRATEVLSKKYEMLKADQISMNLFDWNAESLFLTAFHKDPGAFTEEEAEQGLEAALIHVPTHMNTAGKLAGYPAGDLSDETE